jgi:hypothetical protein
MNAEWDGKMLLRCQSRALRRRHDHLSDLSTNSAIERD